MQSSVAAAQRSLTAIDAAVPELAPEAVVLRATNRRNTLVATDASFLVDTALFALCRIDELAQSDGLTGALNRHFLLILPGTSHGGAVETLDRLREIVAGLNWAAMAPGVAVTMSTGVTSARADDTADTMPSRAERALPGQGRRQEPHSCRVIFLSPNRRAAHDEPIERIRR